MTQGWVKLHREMRRSDVWKDKKAFLVFMALMLHVEYEPKVNKRYGYKLEAGQCDLTIGQLASETDLSRKEVRNAVARLGRYGSIKWADLGANRRHVWTLVNWALYQNGDGVGADLGAKGGPKKGQRRANLEEDQERKERAPRPRESTDHAKAETLRSVNLDDIQSVNGVPASEFDDPHWSFTYFKQAYPTGNGIGGAKPFWVALVPRDRIAAYAGCLAYAKAVKKTPKENRRFIKTAKNWLKEQCWLDDVADATSFLADLEPEAPTDRRKCLLGESNDDLY